MRPLSQRRFSCPVPEQNSPLWNDRQEFGRKRGGSRPPSIRTERVKICDGQFELRARDRMDELMESAGRFFANETDEFRLRFAKMVFNWSDAEWEALFHYAQQLLSEDDRR